MPWRRGATSPAVVSCFQAIACPYPHTHTPALDSLMACSVPRYRRCDPRTSLPGGRDRTGPPGCTPPNTGLQPGPQWGGPSGHRGLGHLPGRHAGLDRCLSVGRVRLCTSPLPLQAFLRSNLIPAYCSPLGTGTFCGLKEAEEGRTVKRWGWGEMGWKV